MHIEFTVQTSYTLVAEDGQLLIIVAAMHGNGQFVLVGAGLGSDSELSSSDDEVMGIEGHIFLICIDDLALNDHSVEDGGAIIDKKGHADWHIHRITLSRYSFTTPSGLICPSVYVEEWIHCNVHFATIRSDHHGVTIIGGCCCSSSCGAFDLHCSLTSDCALSSIDHDANNCAEVSACESDLCSTGSGAECRANGCNHGCF